MKRNSESDDEAAATAKITMRDSDGKSMPDEELPCVELKQCLKIKLRK